MSERINEQVGIVPAIEAEFHLFQVGRKILCAEFMPRSHDAALQQRKGGFHGVGVNVAIYVNLVTVPNGFVLPALNTSGNHSLGVSWKFISHHYLNIGADVLFDVLRQRSRLHIASMKKTELSASLSQTDYDLFIVVGPVPSSSSMLSSADPSFIHLDSTVQHRALCFFHGSTNAMAEIPCGFITDAQGPFHLVRRETLSGFNKQQYGSEPNSKRQVGIVEYCSRSYGEVVFTISTVELLVCLYPRNAFAVATRTLNLIRPSQSNQNLSAFIVGVKQSLKIRECHE